MSKDKGNQELEELLNQQMENDLDKSKKKVVINDSQLPTELQNISEEVVFDPKELEKAKFSRSSKKKTSILPQIQGLAQLKSQKSVDSTQVNSQNRILKYTLIIIDLGFLCVSTANAIYRIWQFDKYNCEIKSSFTNNTMEDKILLTGIILAF